ncbi:MAG: septum formation protein Maf [Bacteroidales bacterium]|nr:septum formation protein Maf [Bacteroidales bacterium]
MDLRGRKLILGSQSPRRKSLLEGLDVSFTVDTRNNFEEPELPRGEMSLSDARNVPLRLSKGKSHGFHRPLLPDEILLTAETVVLAGGRILGKPANPAEAAEMLCLLSGRDHEVVTGVVLRCPGREVSFTDTTLVGFSELTEDEISYYINKYRPFDKAGSYGVQEWIGYAKIGRIEGSYYNVMGLPVHKVYSELQKFLSE